MKCLKWKSMIITCIVCILPVFLGIALWDKLPESIAVHFDINNNPDNFAPKGFAVFGIPLIMALFQIVCCVSSDINDYKKGERKKVERITKWIIPVISVVLQILIFGYSLGNIIDVRRVSVFVIGTLFIVLGNYMPKFDRVKNFNVDAEKARKINRFMGYGTVIMGILALVSLFFDPVASFVWLILLIPYAISGMIYGINVAKRE